MTKQGGYGMTISVDDSTPAAQAIGNDILSVEFKTPRGVKEITGLNSSAVERLLLLADFTITITGQFNASTASMSHDVFKTVSSTSVTRTVTIVHASKTLPNECVFTDYALSRPANGDLTYSAPGFLNSTVVPAWA